MGRGGGGSPSPRVLPELIPLFPGEKLDYKACEALEEIFKRVQFKVVDLEQTSLDEDVSGLSATSSWCSIQWEAGKTGMLPLLSSIGIRCATGDTVPPVPEELWDLSQAQLLLCCSRTLL